MPVNECLIYLLFYHITVTFDEVFWLLLRLVRHTNVVFFKHLNPDVAWSPLPFQWVSVCSAWIQSRMEPDDWRLGLEMKGFEWSLSADSSWNRALRPHLKQTAPTLESKLPVHLLNVSNNSLIDMNQWKCAVSPDQQYMATLSVQRAICWWWELETSWLQD